MADGLREHRRDVREYAVVVDYAAQMFAWMFSWMF